MCVIPRDFKVEMFRATTQLPRNKFGIISWYSPEKSGEGVEGDEGAEGTDIYY